MDTLTDRLHTWVAAGLLEPEQAARIAAFEGTEGTEGTAPPGTAPAPATDHARAHEPVPARRDSDRPGRITLAEAIGYVGSALALGAIALLLGELWRDLLVGGRLALVTVLTAAVFGSGVALRDATSGAMRRLSSVLFTASVAGVGWIAAVIGSDVLELSWDRGGVVVASSMFAVAVPLYLWRRGLLLQLATLASAVATATTWLSFGSLSPDPIWYGLTVGAVGVAWFVLATGGWLAPRLPAEATGAFVALLGVQIASVDGPRVTALTIGLVAAAVLVWLSVHLDQLHHLVVGAVALFVFAPQLVFELFGDAIGAPATLLLVGLLLVLLAVGLGRARREVVHERTSTTEGGGS